MSSSLGSAKIVLLGDSGVGKSSILHRFCYPEQQFDPHGPPTVGAAFLTQLIKLDPSDDEKEAPELRSQNSQNSRSSATSKSSRQANSSPNAIKFDIWDTAGQERYRSLSKLYYHNARAAIIVYDISNRASFEHPGAKQWIEEVLAEEGDNGIKIALVGNKCDLPDEKRQVTYQEASEYAQGYDFLFMETSAKYHTNIDQLFKNIARSIPMELLQPKQGKTLNLANVESGNNGRYKDRNSRKSGHKLMNTINDDSQFSSKRNGDECCHIL